MTRDWRSPFLLGPLGGLRDLPCLPSPQGASVSEDMVSADHTSLTGRRTRDVFGFHRSWSVSWVHLTDEQRGKLRMWQRGLIAEPLRLVDPFERNMLPADVSLCGADSGSADAFTAEEGKAKYRRFDTMPEQLSGVAQGGVSWRVPKNDESASSDAPTVLLTHDDESTCRVPVIEGETVTVSAWLRGDTDVRLVLVPYDKDGEDHTPVESSTAELDDEWQRVTLTYEPGDVDVSLVVGVVAEQDDDDRVTVDTVGWQVEMGDSAHDWMLGAACPEVVVSMGDQTYRKRQRYDVAFDIKEV